jgi:hypothetical protein
MIILFDRGPLIQNPQTEPGKQPAKQFVALKLNHGSTNTYCAYTTGHVVQNLSLFRVSQTA